MKKTRRLWMLLTLGLLSGCVALVTGSPETRFYSLAAGDIPAPAAPLSGRDLAIGMGPVALPPYLKKPQIVTREEGHQLQLGEFDHWGSALDDEVGRLLQKRLMRHLPNARIYLHPWADYQRTEYQVRIDILRFDGEPGGLSHLQGSWSLITYPQRSEVLLRRFAYAEASESNDYAALVAVYARMVAALGDEIAQGLAARVAEQ